MRVDGNSPAIVGHRNRLAVGFQGHHDPCGVAVHHLVDRVVDDFPEQMMQPRLVHPADVHAGAATDGLEALQHGDRVGVIRSCGHSAHPSCSAKIHSPTCSTGGTGTASSWMTDSREPLWRMPYPRPPRPVTGY